MFCWSLANQCGLRWLDWAPSKPRARGSSLFPALGATLFNPSFVFLDRLDDEAGQSQNQPSCHKDACEAGKKKTCKVELRCQQHLSYPSIITR